MAVLLLTFIGLLTFVVYIYLCLQKSLNYWSDRGVPTDNSINLFDGKRHIGVHLKNLYNTYKENRFFGICQMYAPVILIFDLELIKCVLQTNFDNFPDRGYYMNYNDPLLINLVSLRGEMWRLLRKKMTPTFTAGKIKGMVPSFLEVGKRFVDAIADELKDRHTELDMRDLCARYTTDVIGLVAFGINCNSLKDPNVEFRLMGERAFGLFKPWVEAIGLKYERFLNWLNVKYGSKAQIQFYSNIVQKSIEQRLATSVRYNDFLNILIEMWKKKDEHGLTMAEVIGQAFTFFIAGFDTTSSTMSFCLYELCKNPEIQENARRDVLDTLQKHNNELTYECLKDMSYLERVIMETLRKHPTVSFLRRITRKPWPIPNTKYIIEQGVQVLLPVYGIHNDPAYHREPEKFDPNRFLPEEMEKLPPMSYLPFGAGPRNCIAIRFGKFQALFGLAVLLRQYKFIASERTPAVLEFDTKLPRKLSVIGGIHMRVEKITNC